ncbi:hypothetical protein D3C78_1650280 [compost metagenome]
MAVVNRLLAVPKLRSPKFRLVEPPPPLTWQLLIRIRLEVIWPVTVVAAWAPDASVRPSNDKPILDVNVRMCPSSTGLPVERYRQGVGIDTGG